MSEVVFERCSLKKLFLKISQNSQENTCFTQVFSCHRCFFTGVFLSQVFSCHRFFPVNLAKYLKTHLVAASEILSDETCSSITVYILLSHGTSIIFSSFENLFFSFFKALFNVSTQLLSILTLESYVIF